MAPVQRAPGRRGADLALAVLAALAPACPLTLGSPRHRPASEADATDAPADVDTWDVGAEAGDATDATDATDTPPVELDACPAGQTACASGCVDLARDPDHCGA